MDERCNAFGVMKPDEVLTLKRDRAGWLGLPTAEIELRELPEGWIWSVSFQLMQGDCAGSARPLSRSERQPPQPDRASALYCAKAELVRRLSDRAKEPGDARRIMVWLDTLDPPQGKLF